MKQFTITIQDKEGLHARPAGLLSKGRQGLPVRGNAHQGRKDR